MGLLISPVKDRPVSVQKKSVCAVAICKPPYPAGTRFHCFPKEKERLLQWKVACKRDDSFNPAKARVCTQHFQATDYEVDQRSQLMNQRLKLHLKRSAVPTQRLLPHKQVAQESQRDQRQEVRQRKLLVTALTSAEDDDTMQDVESAYEGDHVQDMPSEEAEAIAAGKDRLSQLEDQVLQLQKKVLGLQDQVRSLQKTNWRLKQRKNKLTMGPALRTRVAREVLLDQSQWTRKQVNGQIFSLLLLVVAL